MTPISQNRSAAEQLLADLQANNPAAIERVHIHLPQVMFGELSAVANFPLTLADARTVIAREHGLKSFAELELADKLASLDIGDALKTFKSLVYAGDADKLDQHLITRPELRQTLDDPHFDFGSTALIIAKANLLMVDVLLKHGADINAKSQWWAGDFHILEGASPETARQLIERGATITVHAAAEQGMLDWLKAAYQRDASIIHQRGGDGKTPLHCATDPAVMDWLLQRGADIEARDLDHASTPLQWHLGARNLDAARELVARGAAVDIYAAIMLGELEKVRSAIASRPAAIRARINATGYDLAPRADGSHQYVYTFEAAGMSPHQVAIELGQSDILDFLIVQSPQDIQLLAHCAAGNRDQAMRIHRDNPDLVASLPEREQRQLIHAAWTGKADVARLMAELGFNLHIADDDKMTPLHAAAFHGFADVIAVLLAADKSPPLSELNAYGGTPLTTCLYGSQHSWRKDGDFPVSIQLLVEAGSEVRANWLPTGDEAVDAALRLGL